MINYKSQPVYSFPGKAKDKSPGTKVPGPGNYDSSTTFNRTGGFSFGGGTQNPRKNNKEYSPGPGQYSGDKEGVDRQAPAFGFGSSKRSTKQSKETVGPGSYKARSSFDKALVKRQFRLTSKRSFLGNGNKNSPGPGNYSPKNIYSKLSAPKYGFGTEEKLRNITKSNGPSPDAYQVNDSTTRRKFQSTGMGFGKKMDPVQVVVDTPGPGTYAETTFTKEGKKYSMGGRGEPSKNKGRNSSKSPGPGAYQPDDAKVKHKGPQFGFGTEQKLVNRGKSDLPDPASYEIRDDLMHKTASSVGMGYGSKLNLAKTLAETPGPGTYDFRSTVADGKKIGMGSKNEKLDPLKHKDAPGPGAYSPSSKAGKKAAPNYGFGTSSRLQNAGKQSVPDPATYDVNDNIMKKTASAWGMGYGSKVDFVKNNQDTPGPGAYEHKTHIDDGKKYGMGAKTEENKFGKNQSPGPGAYNSEVVDLKKQHKSYKLGKGKRFEEKIKEGAPGPGLYDARGTLGGPKFGFGSNKRDKKGKHGETPGPADYEIDRSFNNIKSYERGG
eukprot:CAMPEP_0205832248 /NCGR_PEP_ID=MMETSP0206-20130828/46445_1 /ASSEMBLY_ACC=CAM_ASM_000279 /TAXON_ID=36767 /ORGANISM="Euplotes focardii, Strain TN1" /LENGTH=548 /DNA_ID=CAMNT_0053137607 /DNA_START=25 /DNA_END=1671 /DNA_ORIENTATION=+